MEDMQLVKQAETLFGQAQAFIISTDEHYKEATIRLRDIKGAQDRVKNHFEPMRQKTYAAYQEVLDNTKTYSKPLQEAEKIYKKKIAIYSTEQERKRREEERLFQEEARKREEERRLQKAIETGNEEILEAPIVVPELKIVESKPEGISFIEKWNYEIIDFSKLPDEYKTTNAVKLNQVVRALKGNTNIPGIRVFSEKVVRAMA